MGESLVVDSQSANVFSTNNILDTDPPQFSAVKVLCHAVHMGPL